MFLRAFIAVAAGAYLAIEVANRAVSKSKDLEVLCIITYHFSLVSRLLVITTVDLAFPVRVLSVRNGAFSSYALIKVIASNLKNNTRVLSGDATIGKRKPVLALAWEYVNFGLLVPYI